jgi:hypothetical protein
MTPSSGSQATGSPRLGSMAVVVVAVFLAGISVTWMVAWSTTDTS